MGIKAEAYDGHHASVTVLHPEHMPADTRALLESVAVVEYKGERSFAEIAGDDHIDWLEGHHPPQAWMIHLDHDFGRAWCDFARDHCGGKIPWPFLIATATTGTDHIDLAECKKRGIDVISLAGDPVLQDIPATAEHTVGLLLSLVRGTHVASADARYGIWDRTPYLGRDLRGLVFCVVGCGRVGTQVAGTLSAGFAMTWLGSLKKAVADVVFCCLPLADDTRHYCDHDFFNGLKRGVIFVNTARGAIVDEAALLTALESGQVGAAALDVLDDEPGLTIDRPLLKFARKHPHRLLITPHLGGWTIDSLQKAERRLSEKVVEWLTQNATK